MMDDARPMSRQEEIASPFVMSRGLRFPKHRDFIQGALRRRLRKNRHEPKMTEAALGMVGAGDTVIELGAGIGYLSALIATSIDIKSIHSFEANPHLVPYIQSVHAANGLTNAHVTHAILGKRKGTAAFYVRDDLMSSSMMAQDSDPPEPQTEKVDVLNANTAFRDIAPTVLLCDIEGAEADLLPDLDLSNLRAAVVKLHPEFIGKAGVSTIFQAFMDADLCYDASVSSNKVVAFRRDW